MEKENLETAASAEETRAALANCLRELGYLKN